MKTMVIVNTQLQLLNSIECLYHLNISNADILLYAQGRKRMNQLNKLLELDVFNSFFNKIHRITNYFNKDRIIPWISFLYVWYLCKLNKYDNCIIGHYMFSLSKHLIRLCKKFNPKVNIYVVDDGMASLYIAEKRVQELQTKDPISNIAIEGRLLRLYMKSRATEYVTPKLTFFSVFNQLANPKDYFIYNKYKFINGNLTNIPLSRDIVEADIVILGQPLYLNNGIKYADYMKYIAKVADQNSDYNILYYPHPEEKLRKEDFSNFSNIKLAKNDFSIELISLLLPNCKKIVGFFTSALVTLQHFCPNIELQSIVVSPHDVNEKHYSIYEKCYKDLDARGITLLKL